MKTNVINFESASNVANRLPSVEIQDSTTTRGVKPSGEKETADKVETLSKNKVFGLLKCYFTPEGAVFDSSEIANSMQPLVSAGVITQSVVDAAISKASEEFNAAHKAELQSAENIPFATFFEKLKKNETLYRQVCTACKVQDITPDMVFNSEGKVVIYRASQTEDKDGHKRYTEGSYTETAANGKTFTAVTYKEVRNEHNVTNYIQAIRYYSTYVETVKSLHQKVKASERALAFAVDAVKQALDEGFSMEDITSAL